MIGDGAANRVYESADGKDWRAFEHDARWGVRYKAADASFAGALWRVGAFVEENGARTLMNDVCRSTDGRHWQRVLARAPWSPRSDAHLMVFHDTLWLIGGGSDVMDAKIWSSIVGRTWVARQTTGFARTAALGRILRDISECLLDLRWEDWRPRRNGLLGWRGVSQIAG